MMLAPHECSGACLFFSINIPYSHALKSIGKKRSSVLGASGVSHEFALSSIPFGPTL